MRVLVAEDDATNRFLLVKRLESWGYQVETATDGEAAWDALASDDAPRLVILDWMMPGCDGIEICRRVRERGSEPYVYILLLTGRKDKSAVVEALRSGADDFLSKPCDPDELQVRLRAGRRIVELQEELISAREKIRDQAMRDSLTGVWNRAAIFEFFERECVRASRTGSALSIALVDVDRFKAINDSWGHVSGDEVLRSITRRIAESTRGYDGFGRYGGEEFLIVLPDCDLETAGKVAERIRQRLQSDEVTLTDGQIAVSASIGVAEAHPPTDIESLLQVADAALYRAKANGRNRVELARQPS